MDRKAELERKKARLAQLRDQNRKDKEVASPAVVGVKLDGATTGESVDAILEGLGIQPLDRSESAASNLSGMDNSIAGSETYATPQTSTYFESGDVDEVKPQRKKAPTLGMTPVNTVSIPPKEFISYSKECQTTTKYSEQPSIDREHKAGRTNYYVIANMEDDDDEFRSPPRVQSPDTITDSPAGARRATGTEATLVNGDTMTTSQIGEKPPPKPREYTEEEQQQIIATDTFRVFFERASRLVERALEQESIFEDYSADDDLEEAFSGEKIKLAHTFYDEAKCKHRVVRSNCLDWSQRYPELLVAAYSTPDDAPVQDPEGLVCVWNAKHRTQAPEYTFHCQSRVTSVCFAPFHPNLVLAGTYSGQILLWDNRTYRKTPMHRTPLSTAAHTHPVFCVKVVGTQNAHNLISVSRDGKLCTWTLDMLSQPQDTLELMYKQKNVNVTSFAFSEADVNNFMIGCEDGSVFTACRHGSKPGIQELYQGHDFPVSSVDIHRAPGPIDFSHLFLTTSYDWTAKLWSTKEKKALVSCDNHLDYVLGAKWSPLHPAVFASADVTGQLDVWNLNYDREVPTAQHYYESGQVALSSLAWHHTGQHLAVGTDTGQVLLYDIHEQLAFPKGDDWTKLAHSLTDLRSAVSERDEAPTR